MSDDRVRRDRPGAPSRPRRGWPRRRALLVATRRTARSPRALRRAPAAAAARRPARRQHLGDAPRRAARRRSTAARCACTSRRRWTPIAGSSSCDRASSGRCARRRSRGERRPARRRAPHARRGLPRQRAAARGRPRAARWHGRVPRPPRRADPLRRPRRGLAAERVPDRLRREPGSAEMPSAGRPFTDALVTELVTRGVLVAPLVLHAGVSSPERDEPPFPERFRVPARPRGSSTRCAGWGGRVVAVGTTVVRALETSRGRGGAVRAGEGWTEPRHHARARAARRRRAHHRLARARVLAPAHARGRRRARAAAALLRRARRRAGWPATSSATPC